MNETNNNNPHERAFEVWCDEHTARLQTLWAVSNERETGMEYKVYCRKIYTGRIDWNGRNKEGII
jgi:hypothetical protein